jgi:hypothetical protein
MQTLSLIALTSLRELELGSTKLTDVEPEHLKGLTSLRGFTIGGTYVAEEGVKRI